MNNLREPIPEAYFSKLNSSIASKSYPGRPQYLTPSDTKRPDDNLDFTIDDFDLYYNRIMEAIHTRTVKYKNSTILKLDDFHGIDILANTVESSILTPDQNFYGDLHNMGHEMIAFIHDPDFRYLVNSFFPNYFILN